MRAKPGTSVKQFCKFPASFLFLFWLLTNSIVNHQLAQGARNHSMETKSLEACPVADIYLHTLGMPILELFANTFSNAFWATLNGMLALYSMDFLWHV